MTDRADKVSPRRLACWTPYTCSLVSPPEHFGATAVDGAGSDVGLTDSPASDGRELHSIEKEFPGAATQPLVEVAGEGGGGLDPTPCRLRYPNAS